MKTPIPAGGVRRRTRRSDFNEGPRQWSHAVHIDRFPDRLEDYLVAPVGGSDGGEAQAEDGVSNSHRGRQRPVHWSSGINGPKRGQEHPQLPACSLRAMVHPPRNAGLNALPDPFGGRSGRGDGVGGALGGQLEHVAPPDYCVVAAPRPDAQNRASRNGSRA